jgi:hypothetical protein
MMPKKINDAERLQRAESLEDLRDAYTAITADLAPGETLADHLESAGLFLVFGDHAPSGRSYWSYDNDRLLIEQDGKFVIVERDDVGAEALFFDRVF